MTLPRLGALALRGHSPRAVRAPSPRPLGVIMRRLTLLALGAVIPLSACDHAAPTGLATRPRHAASAAVDGPVVFAGQDRVVAVGRDILVQAAFYDADVSAVGPFDAAIDWGDGHTSAGS